MGILEWIVYLIIKGPGERIINNAKNNKGLQDALKNTDNAVKDLNIALRRLEKSNREDSSEGDQKNNAHSSDDPIIKNGQQKIRKAGCSIMAEKRMLRPKILSLQKHIVLCLCLLLMESKKKMNIKIILDILSRDNKSYNYTAEKMAEITKKAIQMFNKDVGDNKVNARIGEHTQTIIESLSEKEQDQFLVDLGSVAKADGKVTSEEKNMFDKLKAVFEQARQNKKLLGAVDEKEKVNSKSDQNTNAHSLDNSTKLAEKAMLAKIYWYMAISIVDGDASEIEIKKAFEIMSKQYNIVPEKKMEVIYKEALQMFNKDLEDNNINDRLGEHTLTIIESLSDEEQDRFLIDLESVAKADGKVTSEEINMLKQLQTAFEQTRKENRITGKADNKNLINPEVDPLPSTAHKIYALYFYIAHIGITEKSLSDSQINDIFQNTLRENIKEESEQYMRQMVTIFYETHEWFLVAKNEINYEEKIQLLCEQVKGMVPPETLDFVVIDLFTSAKVDNRYLDVPERKKSIERMAKIMGVSIQYNGVGHGVHLIGKRAMVDFEGGLDEITGRMSKEELVEGEDSEEVNEEEERRRTDLKRLLWFQHFFSM